MKKIEKIESYCGETGYKLGNYFLIKHYTWGNNYDWIISKEDKHFMSCEIQKEVDLGNIIFVNSCKDGKNKLLELNSEGCE